MMAKNYKELLKLTEEHINILNGLKIEEAKRINKEVYEMAVKYGFISDHGRSFSKKYLNDSLIPDDDIIELAHILKEAELKDIGSLYFSYWREITHYLNESPFRPKYAIILVTILEALRDTAKKELR